VQWCSCSSGGSTPVPGGDLQERGGAAGRRAGRGNADTQGRAVLLVATFLHGAGTCRGRHWGERGSWWHAQAQGGAATGVRRRGDGQGKPCRGRRGGEVQGAQGQGEEDTMAALGRGMRCSRGMAWATAALVLCCAGENTWAAHEGGMQAGEGAGRCRNVRRKAYCRGMAAAAQRRAEEEDPWASRC
jgi:hypothetical protein